MNKLEAFAISSINYFFLKETFAKNNKVKKCVETNYDGCFSGKGYNLYEAHIEEIGLFLNELPNYYDGLIEDIIMSELDEGSHIEDLSMYEIEDKFKKSINFILGKNDEKVLNIYLDIAKKIKSKE